MKLTLIRHGITEGNLKRLYYGRADLDLLPESFEYLRSRSALYPRAERYFTSGMKRAEQSFAAIYGDIPHGVLPGMREIDFGDFEMRSYDELKTDPAYIEWISGDNERNVCPNGESGVMVTERALNALAPVIADGRSAVIVAHGGVIGGVLSRWFPGGNGRYEFTPEPGGGFTVTFEGGLPVKAESIF